MSDDLRLRRAPWYVPAIVWAAALVVAVCTPTPEPQSTPGDLRLWERGPGATLNRLDLRVAPGSENEATTYYAAIRKNLPQFPQETIAGSDIDDMLAYFGFPALPPRMLESLEPSAIMSFERLRQAIGTPAFEAAYKDRPLQPDEILVTRFFAPKIVNVRDPQVEGVPAGGFGWRRVLRFRARDHSAALEDGLDACYLLFNFASHEPRFPSQTHAAQIQAMLVPAYPTAARHRDVYFLVYQSLGGSTPGKVGSYLEATFDLKGVVKDDKYYVPRACGQCHGADRSDQSRGKVNYLDTDHWIDRVADDFTKVAADDVLPDGASSYSTFRLMNAEIEKQNDAVIRQSGGDRFALLAVRKWLDLHKTPGPDEARHVPAIRRGFIDKEGDAMWTEGNAPDQNLLPLLNRYCFRCHSSVRYHVFQKQFVVDSRDRLLDYISNGDMPQDRRLDQSTIDRISTLLERLK